MQHVAGVMDSASVDSAIDEAASKLGYSHVKPEQREAIRALASGQDVFVALPTGYGKSVCYALLPLVFDKLYSLPPSTSIVLCICPLLALMQDQREKFSARGLTVDYVGSSVEGAHERIRRGMCQFVYVSPEALLCNLQWR